MAGEWDKVEGTAKETVGEATGDESTEVEGKAQDTLGHGKDTAETGKEAAEEKIDEGRDELRERL